MVVQEDGQVVAREYLEEGFERVSIAAPMIAARAQPGQLIALRSAMQMYDPLVRSPMAIAQAEPGLIIVVRRVEEDSLRLHIGDPVDILGPVGAGWNITEHMRNILLVGSMTHIGALLFLASVASARACNVTLVLGDLSDGTRLPAGMLPAAIEYEFAHGPDATTAALELVQPALLRWADALFTTLPLTAYPMLSSLIRSTRVRWERGFAFGLLVPPMACFVGICDSCLVPDASHTWRACVDGPQCDVRDFVRV